MITGSLKKGDVIRAVSGSTGGSYSKGTLYIVKSDWDGYSSVMTELDDLGSTSNSWGAQFFERVTVTNTPRAGDSREQLEARATQGTKTVLQTQIGGTHYTDMVIQPITYILANNVPFAEGNAIKYVSRWRNKGGLKDLRKAIHNLQLLVEAEEAKGTK